MRILVTGSSGHLGEALARTLRARHEIVGIDLLPGSCTAHVGSIVDRERVAQCMRGVDAVLHAATLHKPHIVTHSRQDFVDTNVTGTLNLLEEAVAAGSRAFIHTSTTSVFGAVLQPPAGRPAVWVSEETPSAPKNIYGATKRAAEDLCELFWRKLGLPCIVLRTSRFFLDEDDSAELRSRYDDANIKANEYLYGRVDLEDVVTAHEAALEKAASIGFGRYLITATTPFAPADAADLRHDAPAVVRRLFPGFEAEYGRRGWRMFPSIERVYSNERARRDLAWEPRYDFAGVLDRLRANHDPWSDLARSIGIKGYHGGRFPNGTYPTE